MRLLRRWGRVCIGLLFDSVAYCALVEGDLPCAVVVDPDGASAGLTDGLAG